MKQAMINPESLEGLRELNSEEDPCFVKTFLTEVLAAIPPRLQSIGAAIERRDGKVLSFEAHALKSTCANAGVAVMTEICQRLEGTAKLEPQLGGPTCERSRADLAALERFLVDLRAEVLTLPEFK